MPNYLNPNEALKFINTIVASGKPFEIRVTKGRQTTAGIFKDPETAVNTLVRQDLRDASVTITLNEVNEACYARKNRDEFIKNPVLVTDGDITGLNWIFINCKPIRPAGVSSTDFEYSESKAVMSKVAVNLAHNNFDRPVLVTTGNEWGCLVKINLGSTPGAAEVIRDFLASLNDIFETAMVKIETRAFRPSETIPLGGMLAQYGRETQERPYRIARAAWIPPEQNYATGCMLKEVIEAMQGEVIEAADYNKYAPKSFNVGEWLDRHGIEYTTEPIDKGTKYILAGCPWDMESDGGDTLIFQYTDGRIALKCLNDVYGNKTWSDFRRLIEPTAREKKQDEEREQIYHSFARNKSDEIKEIEGMPIIESPLQILARNEPEQSYIKTGVKEIDYSVMGLLRKGISVWTGLRGGGKSSVLSQIALNAMADGNNVLLYSGEMADKRVLNSIIRQVVGRPYCNPTEYEYYYIVDDNVKYKACEWMENKLWIYNNRYPSDAKKMLDIFEHFMKEKRLDLLILDNLMTLDIINIADENWQEKQQNRAETELMKKLKRLADEYDCHVALVAHPRKISFKGLIRLTDVAGTANLGNLVDEAFIIHRVGQDFKNDAPLTFGIKADDPIFSASNIIEVAKDRDNGGQDKLVPLYFEKESRRFKNSETEKIIYPWNTDNSIKPNDDTLRSMHEAERQEEEDRKRAQREREERAKKKEENREKRGQKKNAKTDARDNAEILMFPGSKENESLFGQKAKGTPAQQRLCRALEAFRERTAGSDYSAATERWAKAMHGKWADTMTEEDWYMIEHLE